jgi:hypothetical protein
MPRPRLTATLVALLLLPSCYEFEISAEGGYAQLALDGDFGYVAGSTTASIDQDIESAFGLGDDQGSPYARVAADFGVPNLSVSGLLFSDDGSGVLTANFGENLVAGTAVDYEFDLINLKGALTFEIDLGPVSLAPGVAVDYLDFDVMARDRIGIATEDIELQAPVPLLFLRGEVELGPLALIAEGGYLEVDIEDIEASLLDLEFLVQLRPTDWLHVFACYRSLLFEGDGEVDDDTAEIDLEISGFMLGGGVRF